MQIQQHLFLELYIDGMGRRGWNTIPPTLTHIRWGIRAPYYLLSDCSEAPRGKPRGILNSKEGDFIPLTPAPHSFPPLMAGELWTTSYFLEMDFLSNFYEDAYWFLPINRKGIRSKSYDESILPPNSILFISDYRVFHAFAAAFSLLRRFQNLHPRSPREIKRDSVNNLSHFLY